MITREYAKYNLHIEMLKQSFQRQGDGMTSILLGNATSTAFSFFEKHIDELEQHIKDLESQLSSNPLQLTKHIGDFTNEELMVELSSRGIDGDEFDEFANDYNNEWGL